MAEKGGRIPPDGRPAQAKGVGKNAKRHDLERPATPGLHGSDLQKGDVQAMEQGQRVAPPGTQQRGQTPAPSGGGQQQPQRQAGGVTVPDPIDFLAKKNGPEFNRPKATRDLHNSRAVAWLPLIRQLATGPGASPALVNAFINQARQIGQGGGAPAKIMDMRAADDGIEAMLKEGINRE